MTIGGIAKMIVATQPATALTEVLLERTRSLKEYHAAAVQVRVFALRGAIPPLGPAIYEADLTQFQADHPALYIAAFPTLGPVPSK